MADAPAVTTDAFCQTCRYNLRGLTLDHRCPECGEPVARSVRIAIRLPVPKDGEQSAAQRQLIDQLRAAAEIAGCPADAAVLVFLASRYARERNPALDWSARAICAAIRDYTKYAFGGEDGAVLELASRTIRSSEDVGRIVFAMVEAGIFRAGVDDSPDDFQGLFTLEDLFVAPL
ncbi:MAG: hypothetical protein M3478_09280 [Planctomycetota bacterium]|nr:hypothetical protein [Planctomycetota bacterium]